MRENLFRIAVRKTDSVITDTDLDKSIVRGGGNHNTALRKGRLLHRLDRIHDQIQEHLLQMNRISRNRGEARPQICLDGGGSAEQVGMQKPQHLQDNLVDIYGAPVLLAFANEAMDAVNELSRPPRIGENIVQQLSEHFQIEIAKPMRKKSLPGRGITGDGGQRLIQLVGERRRQFAHQRHPAQTRHLFALKPQVQVRFHLRSHVDGDPDEFADLSALIAQVAAPRDVPARFAIRQEQPVFRLVGQG